MPSPVSLLKPAVRGGSPFRDFFIRCCLLGVGGSAAGADRSDPDLGDPGAPVYLVLKVYDIYIGYYVSAKLLLLSEQQRDQKNVVLLPVSSVWYSKSSSLRR